MIILNQKVNFIFAPCNKKWVNLQIRRSRTFSPTLMIISLVLFSTNLHTVASGQETTVPVKLVTVVWAPHFFAFLAQEKDLFEKNHVNVQIKLVPDYIQL